MKKVLLFVVIILLGINIDVQASASSSWSMHGSDVLGTGYWLVSIVILFRMVDKLPGIFRLSDRLGVVRSGYGYLWIPGLISAVVGFNYVWDGGKSVIEYGSAYNENVQVCVLTSFIVMMWLLKLNAAMDAANESLPKTP